MEKLTNQFKDAMANLASGVAVVTYAAGAKKGGLTVTSFVSVSMDPPLVLFCLKKDTASHAEIIFSGGFAVNILAKEQEPLSNAFAGKNDKNMLIEQTGFEQGNSPLLKNCLANLDCKIENSYDGGDHSIIVGRVLAAASDTSKQPLLYFQRAYHSI